MTNTAIDIEDAPELIQIHDTREKWLESFVSLYRPHLAALNFPLPPLVKVSCGFPSKGGLSKSRPKLGETWPFEASKEGAVEVFVTPLLSDPIQVLAALIAELGWAAVNPGNKERYKDYIKAVGLTGKPNRTDIGDELVLFLEQHVIPKLGVYPHSPFCPPEKPEKEKGAGSRMLKVVCAAPTCGYTLRTTRQWVDKGLPTCACGSKMNGPEIDNDGEIMPLPEAA